MIVPQSYNLVSFSLMFKILFRIFLYIIYKYISETQNQYCYKIMENRQIWHLKLPLNIYRSKNFCFLYIYYSACLIIEKIKLKPLN